MEFKYDKVNKEKLIEDLFDSPYLRNFFIDNDLSSEIVEDNLLQFLNYNIEKNRCLECPGLHACEQDNIGLEPVINYINNKVVNGYKECNYQKHLKSQEQSIELVDAMHLPSSILEASMEDIDPTRGENKVQIMNKMTNFITLYKNGEQPLGLYLWGRNNVGKTYCLSALATELMKNNIKVVIAYYPDLVREFKSKIGGGTSDLEAVISKLKTVDVLMLDDIGGEGKSVWVRDEILGPILQYRFLDRKPTFFSSNMSIRQLAEEHFAKFTNSVDKVSAGRIAVRIKNLVNDNEFKM